MVVFPISLSICSNGTNYVKLFFMYVKIKRNRQLAVNCALILKLPKNDISIYTFPIQDHCSTIRCNLRRNVSVLCMLKVKGIDI